MSELIKQKVAEPRPFTFHSDSIQIPFRPFRFHSDSDGSKAEIQIICPDPPAAKIMKLGAGVPSSQDPSSSLPNPLLPSPGHSVVSHHPAIKG